MKTFRTACAVVALCGFAFLAGCATVYEGQFQFSQGWRVAEVVRVTQGSLVDNPGFWACLRSAPEAARQDGSFVLVSYRAFNRKRHSVVPLPRKMSLQAGDSVYVKLGSCNDAAIAKRMSRSRVSAWQVPGKQSHPIGVHRLGLSDAKDAGIEELSHRTVAGILTPRIEHQTSDAKPAPSAKHPPAPSGVRRDRRGTHDTSIEELVRWIS